MSTALCLVIGWYLVRLVWPADLLVVGRPVRAVLAVGMGMGLVSLLYFANLIVADGNGGAWILPSEVVLLVGLVVTSWLVRIGPGTQVVVERRPRAWGMNVLVLVAAGCAMGSFVLATLRDPHGVADALGIWNLRARLLFDSGATWRQAFAPEIAVTHPDYPLLLPGFVARTWESLGEASTLVPAAAAFGFTFGIAGLLWASLRRLRDDRTGCLAAAAMLGFPAFVAAGPSQNADVPLAFFFLASVALLALHDHFARRDLRLVSLAGFAMGLAAWTKNEGLLFLVALPAVRLFAVLRRDAGSGARELAALAIGATPAVFALLWFKLRLAPTNDLVAQVGSGRLSDRIVDPSRYAEIVQALVRETWSLGPVMGIGVLVWFVLCRAGRIWLPIAVVGVMLGGYCAVYLLTSANLSWHLATSMQRLLLHLLPSFVFGVFSGGFASRGTATAA
ncbi:MAG TPA: glycosyltransferase family 39 protein [Planctomycetota bacterium]|nr:glycosyltransferase family 39 protein [Planctomycetota bacterium]